jgi:hypothetical protein
MIGNRIVLKRHIKDNQKVLDNLSGNIDIKSVVKCGYLTCRTSRLG